MFELPFSVPQRIAALFVLLSVTAFVDWWIKRERATRWREYLFLVGGGAAGAVFGILIDQVTSRISPEYFLFAKMLPPENLREEIVKLGAQAGFTAGIITAGVLLIGNSIFRKEPILGMHRLARYVGFSMIASVMAAIALGSVFAFTVPDSAMGLYNDVISPEDMMRFRTVAGAHYGLYLGGIVATAIAVVVIRRKGAIVSSP